MSLRDSSSSFQALMEMKRSRVAQGQGLIAEDLPAQPRGKGLCC